MPLGRSRLVLLHLFQELVDSFRVFLRVVQREMEFRQPAKLQPLDQFAADESGGMFQRLDGIALFFCGALHVDEDARVLHVRLDTHLADHHHAFEAWIFQLSGEHGVNFVSDLLAHPFVTVIGWTHFRTRETFYNFDRLVDQNRTQDAVRLIQNFLQHFVDVLLFVRKCYHTNHRPLPHVLMVQFRHRNIKLPSQLVLQAAQHLPLVLQRLRVWDVQLKGKQANRHERSGGLIFCYLRPAVPTLWPAASAALSFCTLKHSKTSPTFTSLKFAMPAPHSNPVRTSLASSLKRFSELSFEV